MTPNTSPLEGILLIDKPEGKTSFYLVSRLRRLTSVQKIGHAGTLDPMATGVMVMLIGKNYTRRSDQFLSQDKEYKATLFLGSSTDTYDAEGLVTQTSPYIPLEEEVKEALKAFQGTIEQVPPMFSAKKIGGKKLYELARKGQEIARPSQTVHVAITFERFEFPYLHLHISCSKGTYIRSLAHDIGVKLGSYAHLTALRRVRSGSFRDSECVPLSSLEEDPSLIKKYLKE